MDSILNQKKRLYDLGQISLSELIYARVRCGLENTLFSIITSPPKATAFCREGEFISAQEINYKVFAGSAFEDMPLFLVVFINSVSRPLPKASTVEIVESSATKTNNPKVISVRSGEGWLKWLPEELGLYQNEEITIRLGLSVDPSYENIENYE